MAAKIFSLTLPQKSHSQSILYQIGLCPSGELIFTRYTVCKVRWSADIFHLYTKNQFTISKYILLHFP